MQRRSRGSTHPNLKSPALPGRSHYPAVLFQNGATQTGTPYFWVCFLNAMCHGYQWLKSFGTGSRDPTTSWYTAWICRNDLYLCHGATRCTCLLALADVCRFLDLSSSDSLCPSRAQDLQDPFWDRKTTWLWVKTLVKAKIAGHFKPIPTSNVPIQLNMAMDDSPLKTSIWCPNFPWIPELSIFQKASSHLATVLRGRRSQRSKGA